MGKDLSFHHISITKTHKAFFCIEDLTKSIHTNQTTTSPFTSQQGNRCIMVAFHLDARWISFLGWHLRLKIQFYNTWNIYFYQLQNTQATILHYRTLRSIGTVLMDGLNHPKKNTTMVELFDATAAWLFLISQYSCGSPFVMSWPRALMKGHI